jgi:predicted nicotinamide N-methyase
LPRFTLLLLLLLLCRILELGSGTGLVGILASKLGPPACVALTDGDEQAMTLLEENLANPFNAVDSSIAKSRFLCWGKDVHTFTEWCQQSWPSDHHTFDIIVAGDVMYKKELPMLFFQTVDNLLSQEGVLWLCHVPRSTVNHLVVMQAAEDGGFQIQAQDTSSMEVADCPDEDLNRAVVYRITR